MDEEWRDIRNYEGWYQVSDWGNVRSVARMIPYKDGRTLRYFPGKPIALRDVKGYRQVLLSRYGKKNYYYVHRLVYEAFTDTDIPAEMEINHLDGDKSNNNRFNLETVTHSRNLQHASVVLGKWRDGRHDGAYNTNSRLSEIDVVAIREAYALGNVDQSVLADTYGVGQAHISHIVRGVLWPNVKGPITRVGRGKPKLADAQVLAIREAYFGQHTSIKSICSQYRLGASTVKRILNGKVYQHIGGPIRSVVGQSPSP